MNKPPQPITGPSSVPNPAPSPGLTQTAYGPGQPTSLVFATPPPPQMSSAPQPRQFAAGPRTLHQQGGYRALQNYYQNRPAMPSAAPRVQTSNGPRPVGPAHVYPSSSQMMMISQQQLSFAGSPQGYFLPGQYRAPFMPPTQQYPVTSGTASFYPGTSPAEYPPYDPSLAARERRGGGGRGSGRENGRLSLHGAPLTSQRYPAGAYYPAQPQYSPSVQPAPVMISPAQQQQQAPPPQQPPAQPQGPPKRERKPIRIRDPNQGGRDITEEIMSGGRSATTPTPPQAAASDVSPAHINGESTHPVTMATRRDEAVEHHVGAENPPPPPTENPEDLLEANQDAEPPHAPPPELAAHPLADAAEVPPPLMKDEQATPSLPPPTAAATPPPEAESQVEAKVSDTVDAPVVPSESLAKKEAPVKMEELDSSSDEKTPEKDESRLEEVKKVEEDVVPSKVGVAVEDAALVNPVNVAKEETTAEQPEAQQPEAQQPEAQQPEAQQPEAQQPEAQQPEAQQPEAQQPEAQQPEAQVPVQQVPVQQVPVQQAAQQPAAQQPAAQQPAAQPSELPPSEHEPAAPQNQSATLSPELEPEPTLVEAPELPLANGLPRDTEELPELSFSDTTPLEKPDAHSQEPAPVAQTATQEEAVKEEDGLKPSRDDPPAAVCPPTEEPTTMQPATSVPKKRKNMKELNKKEAIGDLLDAFTEEQIKPAAEALSTQASPVLDAQEESSPSEAADETWEEKEDKHSGESDGPKPAPDPAGQKHQSKEEKSNDQDDKKRYNRDFLLGRQFLGVSMHRPEGLPSISDVVLDKVNKTPLRPADPARLMNVGPDFTPSYLGNLGSRSVGGPRGPPPGPRRSQQGQRKEPRKIISSMSLNDDVQLSKAENAWKPSSKKSARSRAAEDAEEDGLEQSRTHEVLKQLRSILNKLTPQKFQALIQQVKELKIDTEDRLKGAIDLIFEKAILEPNFSVAYANMCRCLIGLRVNTEKPGATVNFRKLLLNRCQKEFERDQDDDEIFERKQKELDAAKAGDERDRLKAELDEAKDQARRRSLGNIKFIGELFKLKMLTEAIMHDCVVKLLKNHDEESLECLCRLLSTIGKDLDFEKAKPRMDQYFNQMDKIIKERKTSSRIRFMLQDVLDLRKNNWVPRRADQGPKTIDQIHKEAEMEEQREQIKVQQQLLSKKDGGGRMGGGMGGRGPHAQGGGRTSQPQDEGWNTVPISKNRPIDATRFSKITKPGAVDVNNQLLAPGGKGTWGSWGKGSSGGSGAKPASGEQDSNRPATSTLNRFSALQQSGSLLSSADSDRRAPPHRSSSSRERDRVDRDRFDRFDRNEGRQGRDDRGSQTRLTKRSFSRESQDRGSRGRDSRDANEPVRRVASMTDSRDRGSRDRGSRDRGSADRRPGKELAVKGENAPTPPPPKPAMTEEEVEKKAKAIIEEYLHINDSKEALQCVTELNSASQLFVFVRCGVESTLERSTLAREHMGRLLHNLVKDGILATQQYYRGLEETLEAAEDIAIDIPHIWLYLAELITPMLHEGGIPMGQLFREISKPLVPLGKAAVLLVKILKLLCKGMTPKKVGAMWVGAGLNWNDFLPEDQDMNKFVTEQEVEFTLGEETESAEVGKKVLSGAELSKELDQLLEDDASNQRITDWVEANLDEAQVASNQFIRALMTCVCQSAIVCVNTYKVNAQQINKRAALLQKHLCDEQKELQALFALQALMVHMEQPANLLRMFFDALYDEDVIKEEAFYKWESSKDPAEQTGKGVALKSVTAFFTWLREAEDESDKE
ncbi:eukaryotic translation initiation factor 4 gamma 1-like isoform X2 [Takifugu rubripes]|uniref:eukaryotic translation initiation factor 4 gamma 1-like isoform X2 n=1 Tax=Takifugu rubripes TaxID=31033 RepID=UPI00114538FF|nr:eukaryotic translation initiation factor 4 gamma 1-like isoform X2 [Takifugu rubripes]